MGKKKHSIDQRTSAKLMKFAQENSAKDQLLTSFLIASHQAKVKEAGQDALGEFAAEDRIYLYALISNREMPSGAGRSPKALIIEYIYSIYRESIDAIVKAMKQE